MFLEQIDIENFRGIVRLSLKLGDTTVLIGENNTGKTTVLEALRMCLSRSPTRRGGAFAEYDYHLENEGSQPVESDPITITLRFAERSEGEWPDEVLQAIPDVLQVGDDGLHRVVLTVSSSFDDSAADFVTTLTFLNPDGQTLLAAGTQRSVNALQRLAPVFYLSALRDSAQEFRPRSQFWGPFVRSLKIEPALRQELEDELSRLNERVLKAHESFAVVKERLARTGRMVPLHKDDPVAIEAIPGRVFDILSRAQVMLTSVTGVRLPIGRHGEGTQSLAVLCLFHAFLEGRLADSHAEHASPILAVEEPEAHLHPAAVGAASILLKDLPGQKIMATHSGDLISGFPLSAVRRFRRTGSVISVHQIEADGSLTEDDLRKLDHHVRSSRGSLLFSRCWLLVEGETDWIILSGSAEACGYDLVSEGISVVPYAQVGIETFVKTASQLGIEWTAVADRDKRGSGYLASARKHIGDGEEDDHIHQLAHGNMEVFLCMEGYGDMYERTLSKQKRDSLTAAPGTINYWSQVCKAQARGAKPSNAAAVVERMRSGGREAVPEQLRLIVECAVRMARGKDGD